MPAVTGLCARKDHLSWLTLQQKPTCSDGLPGDPGMKMKLSLPLSRRKRGSSAFSSAFSSALSSALHDNMRRVSRALGRLLMESEWLAERKEGEEILDPSLPVEVLTGSPQCRRRSLSGGDLSHCALLTPTTHCGLEWTVLPKRRKSSPTAFLQSP